MADAGALDDLDLDDMFNDDGDMLFEGLDIELDGMGDILNNQKKGQTGRGPPPPRSAPPSSAAAASNTNRRAGGPRTKKTNPMLEMVEDEDDGGAKRRKTKRKSKAPSAFGEGDDEFTDEQPKKKRKAAIRAKKAAELATAQAKTKRKRKAEDVPVAAASAGMGVSSPKAKGPAMTLQSVAAAGQFGGRLKRGSSATAGTKKVKRKLKKAAAGAHAGDGTESAAVSSAPSGPVVRPPKPEPTFGGLAPSKTFFYPFLEAVPPEPSLQKRKVYPVMDRISSALTTHLVSSSLTSSVEATCVGGAVTEETAIFKLMAETYEGNEKDKSMFTPEKRAALLKAIPQLRETIRSSEKGQLVGDVFRMCWLLTRQYNFLKQSLSNMNAWCKNDFSHEDYQATYAPPVQDNLEQHKWRSSVVRVKIACHGYKDPKGSFPLFGIIPPSVVDESAAKHPAMPSTASSGASEARSAVLTKATSDSKALSASTGSSKVPPTSKAKRKRDKLPDKSKGVALVSTLAPSPTATAAAIPPAPKTYAESSPQARRQKIMDKVAQLALELERAQTAEASSSPTVGKLSLIPEEDPPLHTARMWEWLQSAGYYKQPTSRRLAMKAPEIHPRGLFLPVPTKIQGHEESDEHVSSNSLFDRLQSLLVEEIDDDDEEEADEDYDMSEDDEETLGFLDEDDDENSEDQKSDARFDKDSNSNSNFADLSGLTKEERAFVQLSSVGLIRKSLFPKVELAASNGENENESGGEDDLVNVIGEMASDLSKITSMNNSRISYLEIAAADSDLHYNKQIEEDQAALIAKCQSLLKRNKEKAKKTKQKKDDTLNLPW